eukprot:TCALIF_12309-PA protein Name:"Similar to Ankrd6 Ankyrin repeat domain-containing protein 6 (Mus musculus)" AED:0.03 eAED:0.03 QI:0/0.75/0.77/0.88/0.87/1/9/51/721
MLTGHTALQRAASEGHLEVVKQLIERSSAIDHQDEVHGNTALHEAAWKGFSRTVEFLCKSKSNYYLRNRGGFSPLHLCCQNGHNETCRMLLRAGCKPNIKNNYGDTPLHTAARYGHAGVARILISAKCNPNLQNKNGDTPMHIAAAMGRRKLVRILLESHELNPDATNQQNEKPVEIAKRKGHVEITELLENPPPKPPKKHRSSSKNTPLSPYGCHYYPDMIDFPEPDPNSLPEEPLQNGEQYFLDLAGNIKKGPVSTNYTCYCAPLLHRVEKKMDRNKKEMFRHLDHTHGKLVSRISHLEKRTKDQLGHLSNNMKETFAQERIECQDRMERRAIRDRIAIERQSGVRDMILRGDLSAWLEKRVSELEKISSMKSNEDAAFMRTLLRSSKRRKRAFMAEIQSGTLRRTASEDYLPGEDFQESQQDIVVDELTLPPNLQELRVSDHPHDNYPGPPIRVRRNSAGDETNMFYDFGDFNVKELSNHNHSQPGHYPGLQPQASPGDIISYSTNSESTVVSNLKPWPRQHPKGLPSTESSNVIYQNFNPPRSLKAQLPIPPPKPTKLPPMLPPKHQMPPPYRPPPFQYNAHLFKGTGGGGNGLFLPSIGEDHFLGSTHPLVLGSLTKTTSDGGSHDSHNDSGYCTRPGGNSSGPSPSLSGSQGRPDSRGINLDFPAGDPTPSLREQHGLPGQLEIGPRIRQLQTQLSLTRLEHSGPEVTSAQGSLV